MRTRSLPSSMSKNLRSQAQHKRTIAGSLLAKLTASVALRAVPCVEGGPGDQELALGQLSDAVTALLEQSLDLGLLASLEDVQAPRAGAGSPAARSEGNVARPQRYRAAADVQLRCDVGHGESL